MLKNFNKTFNAMVHDRVEELDILILNDDSYKKLDNEIDKSINKIKESLLNENKKLISNFIDINNLQVSVIRNIVYKQGFKDGIEFENILNKEALEYERISKGAKGCLV